jgi:2-oxoglutarate ferredoxin oxidoreductase subunit alpha
MSEIKLLKGNEAVAEAAIRAGADGYFGYPITPQSEIMEYLMVEKPHERTGMIVLQAESEVAAINMVYGAASTGKKVLTSSSSPGISLMTEGISYLCGSEVPCIVVNVARGGPGLGSIQPAQSDYFQAVKGGGHGDYKTIVLAPSSAQEMSDFVKDGFELAFKYRIPVMLLSDGVIGQMMEKVELFDQMPREDTKKHSSWAAIGRTPDRERNILNSLHLDPNACENHNLRLQEKYKAIVANEVRYETFNCEDDIDYLIVAYGCSARICTKTMQIAREKGIKVGMLRPITLYPFPFEPIAELGRKVKGILSVEMSAGQMIEDILIATRQTPNVKVEHFGRYGGVVHNPDEVFEAFMQKLVNA